MEPGEVEFLAEKELVTITPNFSENKITLVSVSKCINCRLNLLSACSCFINYLRGPG